MIDQIDDLNSYVEKVTLSKWEQFIALIHKNFSAPCWLFRGQADASWKLQSSFERAYKIIPRENWAAVEQYSMEAFRRRLHLFDATPTSEDDLEWLALMQHHGSPTRLVDWTRSPYVAAYFALDGEFEFPSAIWLINVLILQNDLYELDEDLLPSLTAFGRTSSPEVFRKHVMSGNYDALYPAVPFRQNARLAAQQGVFLIGGNLSLGFEANLGKHFRKSATWKPPFKKLILDFSKEQRMSAISSLRKANIHASSLFPGLDGHARSMRIDALLFAQQLDNNRYINEGHWDDLF
jgi:hypothetical protein